MSQAPFSFNKPNFQQNSNQNNQQQTNNQANTQNTGLQAFSLGQPQQPGANNQKPNISFGGANTNSQPFAPSNKLTMGTQQQNNTGNSQGTNPTTFKFNSNLSQPNQQTQGLNNAGQNSSQAPGTTGFQSTFQMNKTLTQGTNQQVPQFNSGSVSAFNPVKPPVNLGNQGLNTNNGQAPPTGQQQQNQSNAPLSNPQKFGFNQTQQPIQGSNQATGQTSQQIPQFQGFKPVQQPQQQQQQQQPEQQQQQQPDQKVVQQTQDQQVKPEENKNDNSQTQQQVTNQSPPGQQQQQLPFRLNLGGTQNQQNSQQQVQTQSQNQTQNPLTLGGTQVNQSTNQQQQQPSQQTNQAPAPGAGAIQFKPTTPPSQNANQPSEENKTSSIQPTLQFKPTGQSQVPSSLNAQQQQQPGTSQQQQQPQQSKPVTAQQQELILAKNIQQALNQFEEDLGENHEQFYTIVDKVMDQELELYQDLTVLQHIELQSIKIDEILKQSKMKIDNVEQSQNHILTMLVELDEDLSSFMNYPGSRIQLDQDGQPRGGNRIIQGNMMNSSLFNKLEFLSEQMRQNDEMIGEAIKKMAQADKQEMEKNLGKDINSKEVIHQNLQNTIMTYINSLSQIEQESKVLAEATSDLKRKLILKK